MNKVSGRWQEISGPQDAPNLGNKCPNELERRSKPPLTFVTVAAGGMINQWTILYELLSSTGGVSWMSLRKLSKSLPGFAWLLLSSLLTAVAAEFGQGGSRIWRDLYCTAATVTRLLFHVGQRRKTMVRGIHSTASPWQDHFQPCAGPSLSSLCALEPGFGSGIYSNLI